MLGRGVRRLVAGSLAIMVVQTVVGVPVPAAANPGSKDSGAPVALTQGQALAEARRTGRSVAVDGATTTTSTLAANPDGTLTLSASMVPVRKRAGQVWVPLDPTLQLRADGSVAPVATTSGVVLSGGGTGPLASLNNGGRGLALTVPMTLPKPVLSGPTATYANVLPDTDLVATVDAQGGFCEVFVVRTPAAAAALATVRLGTSATGVTVRADAAGNLSAVDGHGRAAFTAAAPLMWDSGTAAAPVGAAAQRAGQPPARTSSHRGPGTGARTVGLRVAVGAGDVTLTPNPAQLGAADLTYPLYYDPEWTPVDVSNNGWATVAKQFHASNYYKKTPDPTGHMQVGNSGSGGIWSHTLINFGIPSVLNGASIQSAQLTMTEVYSYSCTPSEIDVYAPSTTLSSGNATWDAWSGVSLGAIVDSPSAAHGYNSGCPAAGVGFNVLGPVVNAVAAHKSVQTFVFVAANEAGSTNGYKEFAADTPLLRVKYNHPPNTPAGLTTSPSTDCAAATPSAVGDGPVSLYGPVSDPNGGNVGVKFELWKTSAPGTILASSDPNTLTYPSGSTAVLVVPEPTLKSAAGTAATQFSWRVQATDGIVSSAWSANCTFVFDPTRPGAPGLTGGVGATIGQPVTLTITPGVGTTPASYTYQLNGRAPSTVAATGGAVNITVTPTRFTNVLTVTAASAGGNFGDSASFTFNAATAAPQADHDLDGDGNADVTAVGTGGTGLPAGLWLAPGAAGAALRTTAGDIGVEGTQVGTTGPGSYTGSQVLTGRFTGGGLQDVLAYYPSGAYAGTAVIINGNGDGSTLQPAFDATVLYPGTILDMGGGYPSQLVNAGNSAGQNLAYPDLLGVSGDGMSLNYFPNINSTGGYYMTTALTTLTPTGGTDWSNWTLATSQTAAGGTDMFLRNRSTGALYLWTNVQADLGAGTLSFTAHTVAAGGWNTGTVLALQAQDVNHDGITDLRAVNGTAVTTYLTSGVTATAATLTAQPAQTLTTATHQWTLGTTATGPATTAPDTIGTATLTGTGNAAWHTGDLYSPDLQLNVDATGAPSATPNGVLTSAGRLVDTTGSFSVSAWVKPVAAGGVVISEDGTHASRFFLKLDATERTWRFGMPIADTTTATADIARATRPAQLGVWTHLEAGFDASTGIMALYVDGTLAATAHHFPAVTWPATGSLVIGAHKVADARTDWFAGQIADVETFADPHLVAEATTPAPKLPAAAGNIVDMDGDLLPDLVYFDTSGGSMFISFGASSGGNLARATSVPVSSGWGTVSQYLLADWDGDGKVDVLGMNGAADLFIWRNTSTQGHFSLAPFVVLGSDWSPITRLMSGDFNGDGKIDLAGRSSNGDVLYFIPNTSTPGNPSRGARYTSTSGWWTVTDLWAVDYDGDGITDIIGRHATETFGWRVTYSGGTYNIAPLVNMGTDWAGTGRVLTGDFNGDGRIDIATWANNGDTLKFIPNTTVGHTFTNGPAQTVGGGWGSVTTIFTSDYDLDGCTDLIGRAGDMLYTWRVTPSAAGIQNTPLTSLSGGWNPVGVFAQRH